VEAEGGKRRKSVGQFGENSLKRPARVLTKWKKRLGKAETKEPFKYFMLKVPVLPARCIDSGNGEMRLGCVSRSLHNRGDLTSVATYHPTST